MANSVSTIVGNQRGISLMVVLVMVVVLGLAAGVAGSSWKTIVQRSKEAELLFRGDQYRRAIESYYRTAHGGGVGQLPQELDDLLKDPRFPDAKRHIRRLFSDPLTGKDFEVIRVQALGNRIKGVRSSSEEVPFKQDGFPTEYEKFTGATSYKAWEFIYEPPKAQAKPPSQPGQPGQPAQPGQPGEALPETSPVPPGGNQQAEGQPENPAGTQPETPGQ